MVHGRLPGSGHFPGTVRYFVGIYIYVLVIDVLSHDQYAVIHCISLMLRLQALENLAIGII
jgi:hypothetical protein